MATYVFNGECAADIKQMFISTYKPAVPKNKLMFVALITSNLDTIGVLKADRDDTSSPITIDWGDGSTELIDGDLSDKHHTYSSTGTFTVVIENIKNFLTDQSSMSYKHNNWCITDLSVLPANPMDLSKYYGAIGSLNTLSNLVLGEGITDIGDTVFYENIALPNVVIPSTVSAISESAFLQWAGAESITFAGKTISQVQSMANYSFYIGNLYYMTPSSPYITVNCIDGSFLIQWTIECFPKGTKILMADGTSKNVEDITYNDSLKVWDFDNGCLSSASVCWLTKPGLKNGHYYQLTFSDGTILKTTGQNSNHKIYNVDKKKFEGVNKTEVGDRIYSVNGVVTVTDKQYVEAEVEYYNLMTTGKINCFAEGILASNRYSNIYPIDSNMTYVKNGRQARPYSEFEVVGISRYFYDNLRLGEIDPEQEPLSKTKDYIYKISKLMQPLPGQLTNDEETNS